MLYIYVAIYLVLSLLLKISDSYKICVIVIDIKFNPEYEYTWDFYL